LAKVEEVHSQPIVDLSFSRVGEGQEEAGSGGSRSRGGP